MYKKRKSGKIDIDKEIPIIHEDELINARIDKANREAELVIAEEEKAKRADELVIANVDKANREAELVIAEEEKAKRAGELVIANVDKANREAELVIAEEEKLKREKELVIANREKTKRANELIIADNELTYQNKEKAKRSKELIVANRNKTKRANELIIANKELAFQNDEKAKRVGELIIANEEKEKRANELAIANEELEFQNKEKEKRSVELIEAKEKAEESDRLKSAFLSNMSHEIRTPLNGIIGFTELLKEPNLSSDEQQDFILTIQKSGARMLNTINNIVDVSQIESGLTKVNIMETSINEILEFTYKFFKREVETKGLQFRFNNGLSLKESSIKTDNGKVYGVLTNLVKNAIKFTNIGSIEFGYTKKGKYLEFFVKDTGVGISQEQQQIIFERFRQGAESKSRSYEGSGLGLSIAKSYVEMLGGKIWVVSKEGKGSTFYFNIPYNTISKEEMELFNSGSTEPKEVQLKRLKILIVEDDEISYSLLLRILQNISKTILHAITGVEAVETCRKNPDIELILMDIRMPMMDGFEATRQIRHFNKTVIIIAQTAYAFAGDNSKAIKAGCNDFISKPIAKAKLKELINKYCNN
jgi:signal transduction histidine kinase/CheY-like chemotaxis protein